MTIQVYATPAGRLGRYAGKILKTAVPREVLGITGDQQEIPQNKSDTIVFRRWLPYGGATTSAATINRWSVDANAHLTQEGVTPPAETITPQDITVQMNQYSCLYMYTDKVKYLYEDDVPAAMLKQVGMRMALVKEMIRYGALKANTNKFYAGGTSRATVAATISLPLLRKISRSILGNRGDPITSILAPGPDFNTTSVEAAFLVFCHTDCESDIRNIPGFKETAVYGNRKTVHPMELGSVDRYRFIVSPELASIADAGAAVGATGLYSTTGSSIDVYPIIVVGESAWADVALRGMSSFEPTHQPAGMKTKDDPFGQRGYLGSIFWAAAFIQNDGWMAVLEAGITVLS